MTVNKESKAPIVDVEADAKVQDAIKELLPYKGVIPSLIPITNAETHTTYHSIIWISRDVTSIPNIIGEMHTFDNPDLDTVVKQWNEFIRGRAGHTECIGY